MFEGVHKTLSQKNTDLQKKIINYTFIGSKRQIIYYIVKKKKLIEDEGLDNTVAAALLLLKHKANSAMTVC